MALAIAPVPGQTSQPIEPDWSIQIFSASSEFVSFSEFLGSAGVSSVFLFSVSSVFLVLVLSVTEVGGSLVPPSPTAKTGVGAKADVKKKMDAKKSAKNFLNRDR